MNLADLANFLMVMLWSVWTYMVLGSSRFHKDNPMLTRTWGGSGR